MEDRLNLWKKRWTVRSFHKQTIPEKQKIDYLCNVIKYIPAQLGAVDHIWCLLTPEDQELKEWLVHNCYFTEDKRMKHREYFTAIKEAPYVFHSFRLVYPGMTIDSEFIRNNAFHAGVLVSEALGLGLDVAQIVCIDGYGRSHDIVKSLNANRIQDIFYKAKLGDELNSEEADIVTATETPKVYREKIWERFGESIKTIKYNDTVGSKENIGAPCMSVCVGHGLPNTSHTFTKYKDGVTFTGQKAKKWFHNLIR